MFIVVAFLAIVFIYLVFFQVPSSFLMSFLCFFRLTITLNLVLGDLVPLFPQDFNVMTIYQVCFIILFICVYIVYTVMISIKALANIFYFFFFQLSMTNNIHFFSFRFIFIFIVMFLNLLFAF